jgi:hypothetical protein
MSLMDSGYTLPDMALHFYTHDYKEIVCEMLHEIRLENLGLSDFRDS